MHDSEYRADTVSVDDAELKGKFLTFWTDGQLYGVPIAFVVQIVSMQAITEIPGYPHYAKGIMNLRGSIIPITDIRLRLGKQEAAYTERTCIIVANLGTQVVGFIVDAVDEVTYIGGEEISPPPKMGESNCSVNYYLTGIGKYAQTVVLLLDTHRVLSESQTDLLAQVS